MMSYSGSAFPARGASACCFSSSGGTVSRVEFLLDMDSRTVNVADRLQWTNS